MNEYTETTKLPGVLLIKRPLFADQRGFFRETFRLSDLGSTNESIHFVQGNHSRSKKNILRGIHIAPWHKLITVTDGLVQQVIVDCRTDSPTFGQHMSVLLGEDNFQSVFVPKDCGNSFLVLSDQANYNYLTTQEWQPGLEKSLIWNDSDLNIAWQTDQPDLSEADQNNLSIKELFKEKF